MANIKPMSRIVETWQRRAAASTPDYEAGVSNPRADWETQTLAAEKNYNDGVTAAINRGAYGAGVRNAGTAKWQSRAKTVGSQRWAQGVRNSTTNYQQGFEPYRRVIEGLDLPARGPKGDPNNIERVRKVADALHNEKLRQQGA